MSEPLFEDVPFLSARKKRKIYKAFAKFIMDGQRWEDFSKDLYDYLHLYCGFIAHVNRQGFWHNYFERHHEKMAIHFLESLHSNLMYKIRNKTDQDYDDINRAMEEILREWTFVLREQLKDTIKQDELQELLNLAGKLGYKVVKA